jgi:hypothetical protein
VAIVTNKAPPVPVRVERRTVSECIRQPLVHPVAGITLPACNKMTRGLAGGRRTVVATIARPLGRCMIKDH